MEQWTVREDGVRIYGRSSPDHGWSHGEEPASSLEPEHLPTDAECEAHAGRNGPHLLLKMLADGTDRGEEEAGEKWQIESVASTTTSTDPNMGRRWIFWIIDSRRR